MIPSVLICLCPQTSSFYIMEKVMTHHCSGKCVSHLLWTEGYTCAIAPASHLPIDFCSHYTFSLLCCCAHRKLHLPGPHLSAFYVGLASRRHRQKTGRREERNQVIFPSLLPEVSHPHPPRGYSSSHTAQTENSTFFPAF